MSFSMQETVSSWWDAAKAHVPDWQSSPSSVGAPAAASAEAASRPASPSELANAVGHYAETEVVGQQAAPSEGHELSRDELDGALKTYAQPPGGLGALRRKEGEDERVARWRAEHPGATDRDESAFRLSTRYSTGTPPPDLGREVDLSSAESRLAFLDQFAQNSSSALEETAMCGATSLVGGMLLAKGTDGVKDLIDVMENFKSEDDKGASKEDLARLKTIKARLAKGERLQLGDLENLKSVTHSYLNHLEGDDVAKLEEQAVDAKTDDETKANVEKMGVSTKTLQMVLSKNKALADAFQKQSMSINFIDNDGDGKGNHFVLAANSFNDQPSRMVFDPQSSWGSPSAARGQQINATPWDVQLYADATKRIIAP